MKGTEALNLMLTHENIEKIMLPGSEINRKIVIIKRDLDSVGIHLNAVNLSCDRWLVCITLETEGGLEYLWKKSVA